MIKPKIIIEKYYSDNKDLHNLLIRHSSQVAEKAVQLAENKKDLTLDISFIYEAAMLHDIGIYLTYAPKIYCYGTMPYLCHGYLGAELLVKEGFPKHALVCERHTGMGISKKEIVENNLPLPHRDMCPVSLEEQIICFADKFFSKSKPNREKTILEIREEANRFGKENKLKFDEYCDKFL